MPSWLTVIIPTRNEAANLPGCLASCEPLGDVEVVIADCGSTDGTVEIALQSGCRIITAPAGRALQMNAAAFEATGDVLLFLHADCRLPANAERAMRQTLSQPGVDWGAFPHRIDGNRLAYRVIEWSDNVRARRLRSPYGDQAIFVRRELFHEIGGYPEVPLLEEVLLAKQLRRRASFGFVEATLLTDARRWERRGVVRTTLTNWCIRLLAAVGLPLPRLARLYYGASRADFTGD
ncbi:MAG: TIGR04283 family arsenosugar biosynthesis glycosyltransferase [Planctomycetaceae bacterium]